jgi:hypothetical protein
MSRWRRIVGRVAQRPWLAFVLMGAFFFLFGVVSLNLVYLFKANIELILDHGLTALADGAAVQFVELVVYGYLSALLFTGFKVCEKLLVDHLTQQETQQEPQQD